jgi:hypothetical protein
VSTPPHGLEVSGSPTAPIFTDPRAVPNTLGGTTTATLGGGVPPFEDALASLALIEAEYEGIEILAALPNQGYGDSDALEDTVDVSYRIIGRPGVFTVSVPYEDNWSAIAFFQVGLQANAIELIYEGAASLAEPPTQLLVPPPSDLPPELLPSPGHPIPV